MTGGPPSRTVVRWRELATPSFFEDVFYLGATALCFYVAVVILGQGVTLAERLVGVVAFWAVLAYLALPRLNQILTDIYVPDYYIGRTRAADGVLGDPVNVALRGTSEQLCTAMEDAGWTRARPVDLRSAWGIVVSSVTGSSDATAPVSPLFLFGRPEDVAFEQQVDGNARRRHHVRFWRTPEGWLMPGGYRVDWLGAASYDRRVGLSLFTLQVTHKIDADIDVERDHVVCTLTASSPDVTVDVLEHYSTGFHARNGGGDVVRTDGSLPIVDLSRTAGRPQPPLSATRSQDVGARPVSVFLAVVLAVVSVVVTAVRQLGALDEHGMSDGAVLAVGVVVVALLLLALATFRGNAWARVATLGVAAASAATHLGLGHLGLGTLLDLGLDLAIMYALTSASARAFTGRVASRGTGRSE